MSSDPKTIFTVNYDDVELLPTSGDNVLLAEDRRIGHHPIDWSEEDERPDGELSEEDWQLEIKGKTYEFNPNDPDHEELREVGPKVPVVSKENVMSEAFPGAVHISLGWNKNVNIEREAQAARDVLAKVMRRKQIAEQEHQVDGAFAWARKIRIPSHFIDDAVGDILESLVTGAVDPAASRRLIFSWSFWLLRVTVLFLWTKYVTKRLPHAK